MNQTVSTGNGSDFVYFLTLENLKSYIMVRINHETPPSFGGFCNKLVLFRGKIFC